MAALVLFALTQGCSTASRTTVPEEPDRPAPKEFRATLHRDTVADGTILRADVVLSGSPEDLKDVPVAGFFGETRFPFYPVGSGGRMHQGVVGIPFDHPPGPARIRVRIGSGRGAGETELTFNVVPGKYPSEKLRVDPSKVTPPESALERIRSEGVEISAVYDDIIFRKYWDGAFRMPVRSKITSGYGTRRLYNGVKKGFHKGVDLRASVGTPIKAPAPGRVVLAKDLYYTGNTVLLDHGYGIVTIYGHMSRLRVRKGQEVRTGQVLGLAGATGRVNGPHLHWGASVQRVKVNPIELTKVFR